MFVTAYLLLCVAETATEFAISLLRILLVEDLRVVVYELPNLVDVLAKVQYSLSCIM